MVTGPDDEDAFARVDVDDTHSVHEACVFAILTALEGANPTDAPTIVTLVAPVDAPLLATTELVWLLVNVTIDNNVPPYPCCAPIVNNAPATVHIPAIDLDCTLVDDTQRVASILLPPARTPIVVPEIPRPVPTTVTLMDPVAAMFAGSTPVTTVPSYDTHDVKLPTRDIVVTAMLAPLDVLVPSCSLPATQLDDIHAVDSRPLLLIHATPVLSTFVVIAPTMVTRVDPVCGPLSTTLPLTTNPSNVIPSMPLRIPVAAFAAVTAIVVAIDTPEHHLLRIELDDTHIVASNVLPSSRAVAEEEDTPLPTTVTLVAPVRAEFLCLLMALISESYVIADVNVPAIQPPVTNVCIAIAVVDNGAFAQTDVDDSQRVSSDPD